MRAIDNTITESQQATLFDTAQALATIASLAGLDECERDYLNSKPVTQLNHREGYYLSAESMRLAVLPEGADVACTLTRKDIAVYQQHISFPPALRGVVFSCAPKLPQTYAAILAFWPPLEITDQYVGAEFVQNVHNECPVSECGGAVPLSNGIVMCIRNVAALTAALLPSQFIEIQIPVDADMLGANRELFDSAQAYDLGFSHEYERLYLKVHDILASPYPDFIAIAALHTENFDAEFYR